MTHLPIPLMLRNKLKAKLAELERDDIIEDAAGPTPWVWVIVVTPKPKNVWTCVQPIRQ